MGTTLGMVPMVFDKFLIYLRFICKACTSTRISLRKVTGERVKKKLKLTRIALLQLIVVVLSQTKTTLCKTQSSVACTSFCSCLRSEECFNMHTKQVEIELDDGDD